MTTRIDFVKAKSPAVTALAGVETFLAKCGLESSLLHLIRMRSSQLNKCAFCMDIHFDEALAAGENQTRINLISVWRETPIFSEREQVALAWTESVTLISETGGPSDELYAQACKVFTEEELFNLHLAVVCINGWNRFAIAFRMQPRLNSLKAKSE